MKTKRPACLVKAAKSPLGRCRSSVMDGPLSCPDRVPVQLVAFALTAFFLVGIVGCGRTHDDVLAMRLAAAESGVEIVKDFIDRILEEMRDAKPKPDDAAPAKDAKPTVSTDVLNEKLQHLKSS